MAPERDSDSKDDGDSTRTIARLSIAYVIGIVSEALRTTTLDPLDVLIVMTVANSNVLHLMHPTDASRQFGAQGSPAPDALKRGISRNAISRTLGVPLETVRRRVSGLLKNGALQERPDGVYVPQSNPFGGFENNSRMLTVNAQLVRQLFRALKAHGVTLDSTGAA